ncbi:MAG: hypothetical protein HOQ08_09235 [Frateuria sp.]|nr:hypothetical protein [Frateuria sp.]
MVSINADPAGRAETNGATMRPARQGFEHIVAKGLAGQRTPIGDGAAIHAMERSLQVC